MKKDTMTALAPHVVEMEQKKTATCQGAQPAACFEGAMRILTGKWKGQILWRLVHRKHRFGELMRAMPGITQHMLTTQLRDLETHGLVTRTVFAEVPPRVEYALTPAARDLRAVFDAIIDWSRAHGASLNLPPDEDEDDGDARGPRGKAAAG